MSADPSSEGITLETARSVIWPFRGMNRPMGELFDSGRITRQDLAYAANNARDLQVREAALRLLRSTAEEQHTASSQVVEESWTVESARSIIWPFRNLNQPIGSLLDSGQITRKDLAYAASRAREANVRAAATFLLQALPAETVPPTIQKLSAKTDSRIVLPAGDGSTLVRGSSDYIRHNKRLGILKAAVGAIFDEGLMEEGANAYRTFRQGERGEEAVVKELARLLDKRWTIYRNLQLPDAKSDLDAVIVGPSGALVVEIKAFSGSFKLNGDRWNYRHAGNWHKTNSPVRQAIWNKDRLQDHLRSQKMEWLPVFALFVLGREPEYIHIHEPAIPVGRLGKLGEALNDYLQQPALASEQIIAVKRLLNAICPT